jgi:hydroxymethylglutaryl-CoA lyase
MKLIECPRDAMQGIHKFIPTHEKIAYINQLLKVGFDTLDAGSFVSPKAIPQLADSAEVFSNINWMESKTKLLAIVANEKGAEQAAQFAHISYIGFPLSVSETFQQRNTNASIAQAIERVEVIQKIANDASQTLVVYLSMAFGNPYGDAWSEALVANLAQQMMDRGVKVLSLADTVGSSTVNAINKLYTQVEALTKGKAELGLHLHATPFDVTLKTRAALEAGCQRLDGAIKGFGGCPMAADALVGNMDTELMLNEIEKHQNTLPINKTELAKAIEMATELFGKYA